MPLPMLTPPVPTVAGPNTGTGTGATPAIDIAIAIDCSGSMQDEAQGLSDAAQAALDAAKRNCPADVRVLWFGVQGTWSNTKFERNIVDYLNTDCQVPKASIRVSGNEDGARAVEDLSNHFDWRPGAGRVVFFLGDEALEQGGTSVDQADITATDTAIQAAKAAQVSVYTYLGTGGSDKADILQEYQQIANDTGGKCYTDKSGVPWENLLKDIICTAQAQGGGGQPGPQPGPQAGCWPMMPMMPMVPMVPMMPMAYGQMGMGMPMPWNPAQGGCNCHGQSVPGVGGGQQPGPQQPGPQQPGPQQPGPQQPAPQQPAPPPPAPQPPPLRGTQVLELGNLTFRRDQVNDRWYGAPMPSVQNHLPAELRAHCKGPFAALALTHVPNRIDVEIELDHPLNQGAGMRLCAIFVPLKGAIDSGEVETITAAPNFGLNPPSYHAALVGASPAGTQMVNSYGDLFVHAGARTAQISFQPQTVIPASHHNRSYVAFLWIRPMCGLYEWSAKRLTFKPQG
ncbi:MAG: hypothetical protein Tsb0020_49470 [Haliangiales bacterium]